MVDLDAGRVTGELISAPTPKPSPPAALMPVIAGLAARLPGPSGTVGIAFPSVVKPASCAPPPTSIRAWVGTDGAALAARALGRPALLLNDADAAGVAEMRWGAGRGTSGIAIMVTLGTGIGTALFCDGRLFPNTELGHIELRGMDAERGPRRTCVRRKSSTSRHGSRASTSTWGGCMRCSGRTCSFWAAR